MDITIINDENRQAFAALMPPLLWRLSGIAFGALEEGTPIGVISGRIRDDEVQVDFLFVEEKSRRKGAGRALLEEFLFAARSIGADFVTMDFTDSGDAEGPAELLVSFGFLEDAEQTSVYQVRIGDLQEEILSKKISSAGGANLIPLSDAPEYLWNGFVSRLCDTEDEDTVIPRLKAREEYLQKHSFLFAEGETALGCVLLSENGDVIVLDYLCVLSKKHPLGALHLLMSAYQSLRKATGPDSSIIINTVGATTESMVLRLSDNKAEKIGMARSFIIAL